MKISEEKFRKACDRSGGNITIIAKRMNCSRQAVYNYLAKNPNAKVILQDSIDAILDMVEMSLVKGIINEDYRCIRTYLQWKGKDRGY